MRFPTKLLTAAAALLLATAPLAPDAQAAPQASVTAAVSAVPVFAVPAPVVALVQDAKIDINVSDDRGGAWYTSPVWIAIGIIALVLIIALIAMAGRRDTTVVK
jgi:hypothetical protein